MDNTTIRLLKNAYLHNIIDRNELLKAKERASPLIATKINQILKFMPVTDRHIPIHHFTDQFRDGEAKERLDEVVITYLSYIGNQMANDLFERTLIQPGTWEMAHWWILMFKIVAQCVFTLLYDVDCDKNHLLFDEAVIRVLKGEPTAIRQLATQLGVTMPVALFPIEKNFDTIDYHHVGIYGSYYWRLLHWMGEAFPLRTHARAQNMKQAWRKFTVEVMYITLKCPICINHYRAIVSKYKTQLLDSTDSEFPQIWYDLHNEVNHYGKKYPVAEFEQDRAFMKSGF